MDGVDREGELVSGCSIDLTVPHLKGIFSFVYIEENREGVRVHQRERVRVGVGIQGILHVSRT